MPDKRRERFHLDLLRRALSDVPRIDPTEPEPPDFLFDTPEGKVGIEFTEFHLPPEPGKRPYQEQQSLKKRIVAQAEKLHEQCGGPALYVGVYFNSRYALDKKDTDRLAHEIANSVLLSRPPTSVSDHVHVPLGDRPEEVYGILISPSVDGTDKLWHPDAGGWVAAITPDHVIAELERKARRLSVARTRCDKLWLVIVNESLDRAAAAEASAEMLSHVYTADCDRLIWFVASLAHATELRLGAPVSRDVAAAAKG